MRGTLRLKWNRHSGFYMLFGYKEPSKCMMIPQSNFRATESIREADMRGEPIATLQNLYIEQNCFDLDPDSKIHRIMEVQYFLEDVQSARLTHPRAGGATWGDSNENPLLKKTFNGNAGEKLGAVFKGIANDIYAQCWTVDDNESADAWAKFSRGNESVRVSSTPRKILSRLMNTNNPFYGLSHFFGRILYTGQGSDQWLAGAEIKDLLDTLGQALVLSTHVLPDLYRQEKEARLIYFEHSSYIESSDHVLAEENSGISLRRIAFDWREAIDELILGPSVTPKTKAKIEKLFADKKIRCPIRPSDFAEAAAG